MKRANFVAKTLGGYDGDLIANTLVRFEVKCQFRIVTLDNDLCGFLHSLLITLVDCLRYCYGNGRKIYLCANATHNCGVSLTTYMDWLCGRR